MTTDFDDSPVAIKGTVSVERERTFRRITFRTVVLNNNRQYSELLSGPDPTRVQVVIIANDTAAVLCDSQSAAQDAANSTTGLPNPVGALVPVNQPIPIDGGASEIYVATPLTGANVNRISVITVHETDMLS